MIRQTNGHFLGVERSATGRRWQSALDGRGEALALAIAQKQGIDDIIARVLVARGVGEDEAGSFLAPRLRDLMPDPSTLTDMESAAERLAAAVKRGERVAIFGDYDVDGAASAALLWRYLAAFGLDPAIYIPDRVTEGYGPNPEAMRALASEASLIVTVDCGTASFEAIDAANAAGAEVVVLDHHQTGLALPRARALVNPNRQDDVSGLGALCAAGVVFMTLVAVNRRLRKDGYAAHPLPDIFALLDLVALATICDVVPLKGLNRAFVVQGIGVMRSQRNVGLAALARVARLPGPIACRHLGFLIGPRINAGGRIGDAALGSRLLCLEDPAEADALAERLDTLNQERQTMERAMLREAEAAVLMEIGAGDGPAVLLAGSDDWHPGIVGLLAARLKERFNRPAFAIAFGPDGRGTGSGRSVAGIDLGGLVREAVERELLIKGGGHAMAAGITVAKDRLGDLRAFLEEGAREAVTRLQAGATLKLDGALTAGGVTTALYHAVEQAGPFGQGHETPVFALPRHRIDSAAVVGNGHVRATLSATDGRKLQAIAFKQADTELGALLLSAKTAPLHLAGTLAFDNYRGRESVRLQIMDAARTID